MNDIVLAMPKIAEKDGLSIYIMSRFGKHQGPYLKASKGGLKSSFTIHDGKHRVGNLPDKEVEIVQEYITKNREELLKAFDEVLSDRMVFFLEVYPIFSSFDIKLLEVWTEDKTCLVGKFSDGRIKKVDLSDIILNLPGDMIVPLRNPEFFAKVFISDENTICWPNEFDLEPEDLYDVGEDYILPNFEGLWDLK